jgi:hypothetical protein
MFEYRFKASRLTVLAATLFGAAAAQATVVSFDDLTGGGGLVANGYGGVNWNGNWTWYDRPQPPYNALSPATRIFSSYDPPKPGDVEGSSFSFSGDVIFNGAYFAGDGDGVIQFALYNDGGLVATSGTLTTSSTPTFLSSGYAGAVDQVAVRGRKSYVMDDVTFNATAVPEPESYALLLAGLGVLGFIGKRRRAS